MPWDFIDAALNLGSAIISLSASIINKKEELARRERLARIEEEARRKSRQLGVFAATLFTLGIAGAGIVFKWAKRKNSG